MPESKNIPEIKKLQGGVLLPYNIQEVQREDDEGQLETFYVFGQFKLDQRSLPDLNQVRKEVVRALQADLHRHILPEYDDKSQNSINAYSQKAQRLGRSDIQDECEKILDWVDMCLDHYYTQKAAIFSAISEQDVCNVNWDFQANAPKPGDLKSLEEIRGMFS